MDRAELKHLAENLAAETCAEIEKAPANTSLHAQKLEELKYQVAQKAAELAADGKLSQIENEGALIRDLAQDLPDFNSDSLYNKKFSIQSLAVAVFLGWLVGGVLSGILSLVSLGGDILRAVAIFAAVWASEYLTSNPRARKILLTCLGLGGLARFGSMAASGLIRLSSFGSWRGIIFGAGKSVNILKSGWLLLGALFVFIFFSKKIDGLDIPAFRASLATAIEQDLKLLIGIYTRLNQTDAALAELKKIPAAKALEEKLDKQAEIIGAFMEIRDSLDADQKKFINHKLDQAGMEVAKDDIIIWNDEEHGQLYDTVGLIQNGDKAKILKPAKNWGGEITRGFAQRVD